MSSIHGEGVSGAPASLATPRASPWLPPGCARARVRRHRRATPARAHRCDWQGGAAQEKLAAQAAPRLLWLLE